MIQKIRHMSKIIDLYLDDYRKAFSGREIAKKTDLSPQTALINLNQMVKEHILSFTVRGRNKEYKLNLENIQTKIILEITEHNKALERLQNKELKILFNELFKYCDSIILFGSFASFSEKKDSDIDIVVVGKASKEKINQIINKYSREINVEFISLSDFKKSFKEKKALAIEILKKHILFGDIKPIIDVFFEYYLR